MLLFLIIIHKLNCLSYNFQADQNYLLIESISEQWIDMSIKVEDNGIVQSKISSESTQYLWMYYRLKIGSQYQLNITFIPDNSQYQISQLFSKDCPKNCSNSGTCQNLQCECDKTTTGDRCQYTVQSAYNTTSYQIQLNSSQIAVIQMFLMQNQLIDDQGDTKKLQLWANGTLASNIYLLLPFTYPNQILDSNLIYQGQLSNNITQIDYSNQYSDYHIKTSYYSIVFKIQNSLNVQNTFNITYNLKNNEQSFQDFILISILSVISFIILLIVIYIVRRRCQYLQQNKKEKNEEEDERSQNQIVSMMPVVNPAKDQECIICLDPLDVRECRMTSCKHIMHDECLKQWIEKQTTCPLCREPLTDFEIVPIKIQKSRNQTSNTFLQQYGQSLVNSERNSVRSMIITRSRQGRLAAFQ